jgi:hypothetical protein
MKIKEKESGGRSVARPIMSLPEGNVISVSTICHDMHKQKMED